MAGLLVVERVARLEKWVRMWADALVECLVSERDLNGVYYLVD